MLTATKLEGKSMFNSANWLLVAALLTSGIYAAERPTIPIPGHDLKLSKGQPLKEFFATRLANQSCQNQLESNRSSYKQKSLLLDNLIKKNASAEEIDSAEQESDVYRSQLLSYMEKCGECATQELEKRTVITNKKEYWYITDGSCLLKESDPSKLNIHYDRAVKNLLNIKNFPRTRNGFSAILNFDSIDMETGEILSPVEKIEATPFYAFIAVKGPAAFGLFSTAFTYVFRNDIEEKTSGDLKEFLIRFNAVKPPSNFSTPDIYIVSASGHKKGTIQKPLSLVQGMWYVNNQGYFRYYTAADFGMSVPFGDDFARTTLLDTVLQLSERSTQEE